jgi:hypothetical protein
MNDLPIFLQMFARLFAAFALGAWLQTLAPRTTEKSPEAERACPVKPAVHAQADPSAKPAPAPAPADGK